MLVGNNMTDTPKKLSFFDVVSNINEGPKAAHLLAGCPAFAEEAVSPDSPEKAYVAFMINRSLSYFQDSVLFANEMNRRAALPPRMQYDFLRNTLRPRKRFSKWVKALPAGEDVELLKEHYGYSTEKAREAVQLLTSEQLAAIRKFRDKGGR